MSDSVRFAGDFSEPSAVVEAAMRLKHGALALDNHLVYALWGNGDNPDFRDLVAEVKGSEANKPFGLTVANKEFLEHVDVGRLEPAVASLFEDPELLTALSGAVIFWRLPGRASVPDNLPETVWSLDEQKRPVIQNWSPEGKPNIMALLEKARQLGVTHSAVTSLNITTRPEITSPVRAQEFAEEHNLSLLTDNHALRSETGQYPVGSYPVVAGNEQGLQIVRGRANGIGTLVLSRLLAKCPITWTESKDVQPGWDLPELKDLQGAELRLKLHSILGWTANRTAQA